MKTVKKENNNKSNKSDFLMINWDYLEGCEHHQFEIVTKDKSCGILF